MRGNGRQYLLSEQPEWKVLKWKCSTAHPVHLAAQCCQQVGILPGHPAGEKADEVFVEGHAEVVVDETGGKVGHQSAPLGLILKHRLLLLATNATKLTTNGGVANSDDNGEVEVAVRHVDDPNAASWKVPQGRSEPFAWILERGGVLPLRGDVPRLVQQHLPVNFVLVEHHPAVVETVEAHLVPHVPNGHPWQGHQGEGISYGDDKGVEAPSLPVLSEELGIDAGVGCGLGKVACPALGRLKVGRV